ncbi:Lrp/AsnC family transcriptional regulator [Streptomyces millisiae]|uniref:Lrp/AsnC ligand binding domain-containing protein n=1 Tax=Streptomyces millisiae TaxID=3075542 RepID=A0ABU2LXJ8_9ACTN|nr:Lrp/AsnC ligand binding domain-containing protein [Streptomyces sp. DSM 44918]MDT0322329.1 Lrp/AsnC ligand binding domain-containing protein [Streptomyces sp. DSM 44918]
MRAGFVPASRAQRSTTSVGLDELDLAIVHALQVQPRAPWTLIGEVLEIDPVTAARRWARLRDSGAAWIDGYLSPAHDTLARAQLEITVDGSRLADVANTLSNDPAVLSLKQTSGTRELLAIVWARDLDWLAEYVTERVCRVPGVRTTRLHVITAAPFEGSQWRLRALSPAQVERLRPAEPRSRAAASPDEPLRPLERRIAVALGSDGRMPLAELATVVESSVATTRRGLARLLRDGLLSLRCNLARPLTGWPVSAVYFASVPAEHLEAAAAALRTLPELRLCTMTAGPHNLILDVWLRTLHDVHGLEAHLARELGHLRLRITDRAVVLRTYKHVGRVLDRRGHSVRAVPTDLWD